MKWHNVVLGHCAFAGDTQAQQRGGCVVGIFTVRGLGVCACLYGASLRLKCRA